MKALLFFGLIALNAYALPVPGIKECTGLALKNLRCYELGGKELNELKLTPRQYTRICMLNSREQKAWCAKAKIDPIYGENNCYACYR